jgi:hypothetical protein
MARAFSAPRSNLVRVVPTRRPWDKETMVVYRERQQTQPREIRVTFEPSRLSDASVAQAYEQVVPIVRRLTAGPSSRDGAASPEASRTWAPESASTG